MRLGMPLSWRSDRTSGVSGRRCDTSRFVFRPSLSAPSAVFRRAVELPARARFLEAAHHDALQEQELTEEPIAARAEVQAAVSEGVALAAVEIGRAQLAD